MVNFSQYGTLLEYFTC